MIPTLAQAAADMAARRLSPVELTRALLDRSAALNPTLHAFIRLTPELAMAQARAAEARQMAGARLGPLDGIPIAHKDIFCTAGVPSTGHSRTMEDHVPAEDAAAVAAWAEAGAVMLGKTATHEFAWGGPSSDLPWPPARNPWDVSRFTGGSSSGSGAAVAAGMVLGATGSDTGGSIRNPAHFCGLAGMKPTFGLASRRGVMPLAWSLDTVGPLAWTVEDVALLTQPLLGPDAADPGSALRPAPDLLGGLDRGVKGLRIGLVRHFHEDEVPASPFVRAGIDHLVAVLAAEGACIQDVTLPPLLDFHDCGWVILMAEAAAVHEAALQTRFRDYGEILRERLALAHLVSARDYVQAQRRRRALCAAVARVMEGVDLLVTTGQAAEAPPIEAVGTWASIASPGLTIPFNVTGQPVLSVCTGFGAGGLPTGAQIVARPFEDALALRAGFAFERATGHRARRPAL
jgi:aspartyl-tRNA(Asn)/glutamyl-tRNA(Gln) amidotransferase subunit A